MIEIEKPKIETVEISDDAKFGKFVVEPLERGYGTTLGNSLRRILLSSLPGAAVTSIQIDGVLHEFSTIEGVVEDVTTIILHIKKLALKIYSDEEKTLEIDVQGEGTVTANLILHTTAMLKSLIRIFISRLLVRMRVSEFALLHKEDVGIHLLIRTKETISQSA